MFFKYSWSLPLNEIAGNLLGKSDRYFIAYFMGPAMVGVYHIAYMIVSLMGGIAKPLNNYLMVYMPKIWDRGNRRRVMDHVKDSMAYYLVAVVFVLVILTFYADDILLLLLGKHLPPVRHFGALIFITGIGIISNGLISIMIVIVRCTEKNFIGLMLQCTGLVVNISLNSLLIPFWGLIGAGAATFAAYTVNMILISRYFNLAVDRIFYLKLLKIVLAGGAVALLLANIDAMTFFRVCVNIALAGALYLLMIFLSKGFTLAELKNRFN
jgi:O-antigen/teichoic acid export membrane protein